MEDQHGPDEEQDIAEAAPQVGGRQRDPLQNELPADSVDAENDDGQAEPEEISDRKGLISLGADLEAGRGQALHEDGESGEKKDISPFVEKMFVQKNA